MITAQLARACPGMFSLDAIEYDTPLTKVMALCHAGDVLDGHRTMWPDATLDPELAFAEAIKQRYARG